RHQPVGGLVMLVDTDAVETELVGKRELAKVALIKSLRDCGIEIGIRQRDPRGIVALRIGQVQVRIGHQMKEERLHGRASWRNGARRAAISAARSAWSAWPDAGRAINSAWGICSRNGRRQANGTTWSSSPQINSVGILMRCSQRASWGLCSRGFQAGG